MQSEHSHQHHCHRHQRIDYLLWVSLSLIILLYGIQAVYAESISVHWLSVLSDAVFELVNTIWWGLLIGILMIALLSKIPREFVIAMLGRGGSFSGIVRATLAGVLLDLCSHGILMVGAKLYERGASAGQLIAFLVASPWNSFSLTLILITLIGLPWTLTFLALSLFIAIITGSIFDWLVSKNKLPANPNQIDLPENFQFWQEAKNGLRNVHYSPAFFKEMLINGIKEARMVLRWILLGVLLAALIRTFVDTADFQSYFGPTLMGLGLTLLVATIIEVCSEGSTPVAADLLTRAHAPGNSFAFLMTGVATDYTEIMVIKDSTRSWKFALCLPLIAVPQVIVIAWLMNTT